MKNSVELLLECKTKLGIESDYALAKVLEINSGIVCKYMKGQLMPDSYVAMKIAEILGRDPLEVIALVEAESAKNEKRREFWNGFLSRARKQTATVLSVVMLVLSFGFSLAGGLNHGFGTDRASGFGRRFKHA